MCAACVPHVHRTACAQCIITACALHMCTACQVLDTLHFTYDSVDSADDRVMNVLIMLGMALVYKARQLAGLGLS